MTENLKKKALQHKVTPAKSENLKKKKEKDTKFVTFGRFQLTKC